MPDLNKEFDEISTSAKKSQMDALKKQYELFGTNELENITRNTSSSDEAISAAFQVLDERKTKQVSPERVKQIKERIANDPNQHPIILIQDVLKHPDMYDPATVEACRQLKEELPES